MKNKTLLVTGGTSGIGYATAKLFLEKGCNVIITGRNPEKGKDAAKSLLRFGNVEFHTCDTSSATEVKNLYELISLEKKELHFLCNNAATDEGIGSFTADLSEEMFDRQISVNLKGVWLNMKHAISLMAKAGNGSIVNISSINGLGGTIGASIYSAAKHGVIGLTKSAALEYAKAGLRINAICPGMVMTPALERVFSRLSPEQPSKVKEHFEQHIALNRIAEPHEIAEAVYWLCSTKTSFITGQAMVVDGGMTCQFR